MTSLIHQYQNSQGVSRDPVTGRWVKDASIKQRRCCICRLQHPNWYKYGDGYICKDCWREIDQSPRRMYYKGRDMIIPKSLGLYKKGRCADCDKERPTTWSHTKYDDANPFAHVVERCKSCHNKYDWSAGIYANMPSKVSKKLSKKRPESVRIRLSKLPRRRSKLYLLQSPNSKTRFMSLIS